MDRTIGPWDCLTIFWTSLLTISGGGGGGGWEIVLALLINGVLTGSHKQFSRLNFLCQGFCAELLRFFNFVFFFFIDPISGLRRQEGSRNFWSLAHN